VFLVCTQPGQAARYAERSIEKSQISVALHLPRLCLDESYTDYFGPEVSIWEVEWADSGRIPDDSGVSLLPD
jgi:hypothetical protein